ncbi:hypothetical protein Hte_012559 [Hypoxylon texense]
MTPRGWGGKAVGLGTAIVGLLILADFGMGQSTTTTPTCLQPITGSTPTAGDITNFLNPLIDQACTALGSGATQDTGFVVPVASFNKTGYLFAKINIENVVADMGECRTAYQSIISGCISSPPAGVAPSFGGQWSSNLKLSYTLVSLVYPDKNPLVDTPPPPASSSQSSSTSGSSQTMSTTSVSSISRFPPPPTRTSLPTAISITHSAPATITLPPGGGPDLSNVVEEIAEALALAAAAAALLLAASFLIAVFTPLVAEAPALAALVAIQDAESVVTAQLGLLKPTAPVLEMIDKVFAARFAGLLAQGVPNPVTAGILVSAIALALETVPEIIDEVEKQEEENQSSSQTTSASTTSSTSSSASPAPTEPLHIVGFSNNWPDLLLDVITDYFPDDGEGDMETVDELSLKYYATNMTEGLANAISWLPIFDFIVPDEIIPDDTEVDSGEDSVSRRRRDEDAFSGHASAAADLDHEPPHVLDKRVNTRFPIRASDRLVIQPEQVISKNPPLHLRLPSFKEGQIVEWDTIDKHPPVTDSLYAKGVSIHIIDSGLGPPILSFPNGEFSSVSLVRHAPSEQNCYVDIRSEQPQRIDTPTRATLAEDLADESDHSHGTCAADVAAGRRFGFARHVTLHSWKDSYKNCSPSSTGLINIFKRLVRTITDEGRQKKTVISYSQSFGNPRNALSFWEDLLKELWPLDVVFVASGGQSKTGGFTKDHLPQAFGDLSKSDHPVINVGGVNPDGTIPPKAYKDAPPMKSLAVYTLYEVTCFKSDLVTTQVERGTSFAAPAVAGVIATWLVVPEFVAAIDASPGVHFSEKVRSFLMDHALLRTDFPGVPTLYNGWLDSKCQAVVAAPPHPKLAIRQQFDDDDDGTITVLINGTVVDPDLTEHAERSLTSENQDFCPLPPVTSTSTTTSSTTSTTTSSTSSATSSTPPTPVCDPQISCDACAGTFSAGHDGLAVCTTGASKGCQCVPGSNQCGTPQPCSMGGCAGTTDVGTQGATCKGNFKGCTCTIPCDAAAPPILDGALNMKLYNDTTCCSAGPTVKVADLDKCLDAPEDFYSFHQAVGQSLFGRGITIQLYPNKGCSGSSVINGLTNAAQCWSDPNPAAWKSFKISNSTATTTPPTPPSGCTPVQPVNTDSFTVTLNIYAKSCCDAAPAQVIKAGTLNACHQVTTPFTALTQAVGQNLLSGGVMIQAFSDASCASDSSTFIQLSNDKSCVVDQGDAWQSFMLVTVNDPGEPDPDPGCIIRQPGIADADTISVNLYAHSCCEAAPVQTLQLGELNACVDTTQPFADLTQSVGQGMFGRNLTLVAFPQQGCTGLPTNPYFLTNTVNCYPTTMAFNSIMISGPSDNSGGDGSEPPPSQPPPFCPSIDNKGNPNTLTLGLYKGDCCIPKQNITIGVPNTCHDLTSVPEGFKEAVGSGMFANDYKIVFYPNAGCTGAPATYGLITQSDLCLVGGPWKSVQIITPPPPTPPPPSCAGPPDNKGNDNTITLNLYKGDCCTPKSTLTIGAASIGRCEDISALGPEGFTQSVGQNLFGRNLLLVFYFTPDCSGSFNAYHLTNAGGGCETAPGPWLSAKLFDNTQVTCAGAPNNQGNPNTVTLDLYKGDCCTPKSTLTIGAASIGKCISMSALGPEGFKQSVGQALFGRNLVLVFYFTSDCSGGFVSYHLTNAEGGCQVAAGPYNSVKLFDSTPPPPCAGAPNNQGNPNTVTLDFYKGDCCHPKSTVTVGVVNACHNLDGSPEGFHQAVGQNMFGKGYKLVFYAAQNCGGGVWTYDLTNKDACWTGGPWNSFRLLDPAPAPPPPPPPPQCGSGPKIRDDDTLSMVLYTDASCCHAGEIVQPAGLSARGVHTGCINLDGKMLSIKQAVGQDLFGHDNRIRLFPARDCASGWSELQLTNADACWFSNGGWLSLQAGNFDPPPPAPNWILSMYRSNNCAEPGNLQESGHGALGCQSLPPGFNSYCPLLRMPQGLRILLYEQDNCAGGGGASIDSTSGLCSDPFPSSCTEFDNMRSYQVVNI